MGAVNLLIVHRKTVPTPVRKGRQIQWGDIIPGHWLFFKWNNSRARNWKHGRVIRALSNSSFEVEVVKLGGVSVVSEGDLHSLYLLEGIAQPTYKYNISIMRSAGAFVVCVPFESRLVVTMSEVEADSISRNLEKWVTSVVRSLGSDLMASVDEFVKE